MCFKLPRSAILQENKKFMNQKCNKRNSVQYMGQNIDTYDDH